MKLIVTPTPLAGLVTIEMNYPKDERGFFIESWHQRDFAAAGLDYTYLQEGHSRSRRGVLRGLHYQDMTAPMAKLLRCVVGQIYDVAVDLRVGSPTFGQWLGVELSSENQKQIFVPVGFAHGFLALSETVEVIYKMTQFYTPSSEGGVIWNDPDIGVKWPITDPILSARDAKAQTLKDYLQKPAFPFPLPPV